MTASGAIYRLGLALLDLENPTQVIYRSDEWIFQPQEDYERFGDVDKVVFPCGWVEQDGQVRIYYGARRLLHRAWPPPMSPSCSTG